MYIESNKNTEIIDQFYTISDSINGVPTIEVENIEIRKEHGDKITMSSNRIKDNFVMVIKEEKSHGDIVYTDMSGVHSFIYDMSFSRIYETKTQYFALESILEYVFAGSGYTYKVDPNAAFYSLRFENFGDKDRLSLINQICDRWKIEYHVNGNKVYFSNRIGADKNSQLRYKMNINDTQVNLDISKGATYIRGYFGDKEKGTYKEAEYLHPLASEYGKLHAEPYSNESITQEKTMNEYMKRKIEETWSLSIKIDVADIDGKDGEDVSVGDTVWAIDERHDIKMQTRIIEMTKHYDNNDRLIKTVVTLGNKTFADLIVTQMLDQTDTTEKIVATNERLEGLKAEFDNGFNAIEQKIVTDIAAVEQQAIDEVNALDEKFAVGLQEHKTSLQADINASYDAAVAKAEQKAKILDESISQMVVDNKAATDKVISQLNDSLGDISSLSGTIADVINQAEIDVGSMQTTVGQHTTSIANINDQLTLTTTKTEKAEKTITQHAASIKAANNEISKRVTKTDFDTRTGAIAQIANSAKSTADTNSQTISTVKGQADDWTTWKATNGTNVLQTINEVSQKVWQNDIDTLSFENRNLIVDSASVQMTSNNNSAYPIVNGVSSEGFKTIQRADVTSNPKTLSCYTQHFFPVHKTGIYTQQIKVRPAADIYLSLYGGGDDVLCKANEWTTLYRYIPINTVPVDNKFRVMGLTSNTNDFTTNNPVIEYKESKVEFGSKATPYSKAPEDVENRMVEISATADAAKLQANSVAQDYVKQSAVVVKSDGVMIGSKKVSGKEMASAISVTPSNVDIITKVMRITADMQVAGDIKALSISAVDADIARIRTNILTADSVTSTAIKADAALINKLNTNSILTKYLISDTAIINAIKSHSISAVRGDIAWLKSNIITANSISSTSIKSDLALIDKIFSNSANVARLTSKSAFIKQIQAIEVVAYRLEARDKQANVNIENGSITMNRSNGTKMDINIDGIQSFNSGGSLRFSLTPSLVTTSAVGTSISNVYLACQHESEARVIDMDDVGKDGKIGSYRYKPIRALALKFGLGANGYIGVDGNELRIMSDGLLDGGYKNVRADKGYFSTVDANNEISGAHFYIRPKRDGELRVTHNNGGATSYANLRSNGIYAPYIDYNGHINGGHLYLRPSSGNEVRFTMTGTTNNWANIRFGSWNAMSHEKYKYDIEEWDYEVLDIYRKDLQLHRYKVGHEKHKMIHHGIILREDSNKDQFPVEWRNGDGYEGTEVLWWNAKAVQELAFENDELRDNVKTLENNQVALKNTVSDLENRLKILEEKLNE